MVKETDSIITNEFVNGSIDAFNTLYHRYKSAVFANICKIIKQQDLAEDILQEVFLSLWKNRFKFKEDQLIAGWLFVVSYNKSINCLKKIVAEKRKAALVSANDTQASEDNLEGIFELQIDMVNEAISLLPERKRKAFTLCKLEGKSYAEAAQLMDVSPETIKEYLKISFKFIRNRVLNNYDNATVSGLTIFFFYLQL
jgi:RNA polymerase sigma-70 factor (ECF subfamily)